MHRSSFQMNMLLHSAPSLLQLKLSRPLVHSEPVCTFNSYPKIRLPTSHSTNSARGLRFYVGSTIPSNQGTDFVVHFKDLVEKDWSFLETGVETSANGGQFQNIDRIISAGKIEETSKVLVSIGSEGFVDRAVSTSPCTQLFVVHDSLLTLACIKEKYDGVKCWQGELISAPEKWASFDVIFLYFLPGLPFGIGQILAALAKRCLPGARLVISHPQGRHVAEEQQGQYPDIVVYDLPDELTLRNTAVDHSFEVAEFVDEPGFYLAVLRFNVCELENK